MLRRISFRRQEQKLTESAEPTIILEQFEVEKFVFSMMGYYAHVAHC